MSDTLVAGMMKEFGSPERLTLWARTAMSELRNSICRDLKEKQLFAFFTRLRQPEELYIRTLYALFVASSTECRTLCLVLHRTDSPACTNR